MLRSTDELMSYLLGATDGTLGDIKDFYFDDQAWVIRYLVVETGVWFSNRKVLISPIAIGKPDWSTKTLPVALTWAQVKDSPNIDTEKPVSRQQESDLHGYYGHPYYWGGKGLWGGGLYPYAMLPGLAGPDSEAETPDETDQAYARTRQARQRDEDPHLRSCAEVLGYDIAASDGEIGQVRGFLVDDQTWALRYLVVHTSRWWIGHDVLIAPQWIDRVSWADKTVSVHMTRQAVKDAPIYDPTARLDRQGERELYEHHARAGDKSWPKGAEADAAPPRR